MDQSATCATCVYWKTNNARVVGDCHVTAPQVVLFFSLLQLTLWPKTEAHEFCGRWVKTL